MSESHEFRRRFFDNAATSSPKPPGVARAMMRFMEEVGAPGRGAYREAVEAGSIIRRCRERILRLINGESSPERLIFTHNATDALNIGIKGVVEYACARRKGGTPVHVVSTASEHNSVLRPMNALVERHTAALGWTRVEADSETGIVEPEAMARAVRAGSTALVIVNHASNVTGAVQDIREIAAACRAVSGDLLVLVDASQSIGHVAVDVRGMGIDLCAFPGHKGLLGPQGTGGLYIAPGVEHRMQTIREGGTGSASDLETHPESMPDRFEAGSHNAAGIAGLSEGAAWLLDKGIVEVRRHELTLMRELRARLALIPDLRLLGSAPEDRRVGVYSFTHASLAPHELAGLLEGEFGILTRAGVHCAPLVHRSFGTANGGAVRMSLGPFLTIEDVRYAGDALLAICRATSAV